MLRVSIIYLGYLVDMSLRSRSVSSPDEEAGARPVKRKRANLTRPMVRQACVMCAKKKARVSICVIWFWVWLIRCSVPGVIRVRRV